jgi:hypothetical protein
VRAASLFSLGEVFDDTLHVLDHTTIVAYVPDDYQHFGNEVIRSGENATYFVGHDIWRTADLEAAWPPAATVAPIAAAIYGSAILSRFSSISGPSSLVRFPFACPGGSRQRVARIERSDIRGLRWVPPLPVNTSLDCFVGCASWQ